MGLHDITQWLRTTCAGLAPGEMIKPDSLQLLDAMNAVEVGHEKTDTGIVSGIQGPPAPFNPFTPITAEELCWIIDRLVRLEVAWHQSTPICQCVYSSLYYHNFQLLFTGYDSGAAQLLSKLSLEETDAPMELITVVLKSYILSYRKTLDLVFVELAKGNVVDGEDCWLDDYGLGVTLTDEVEEVLELGDVAEEWLRSTQCPVADPWRSGLLARVSFRNNLLNSMARLTEAPGWPRITTFGTPQLQRSFRDLESAPVAPEPSASSPARAAFDDRVYTSLRQHMPLPKMSVPNQEESMAVLRSLVEGMRLADVLGSTDDFSSWELSIRGKLWNRLPMLAFVRSLLITTLTPTRETLFRQHSLSIDWLADEWLVKKCGMSPGAMRTLGEALQKTGAEVMALPSFRRWRDILTGNLVNSLTVSLHNRPRHRRSLLSSSVTWAELADDARAYTRATQYFPAAVATALEVLRLDALLEGSLLGWELDLIDRAEEREAWWWVSTVAERRGELAVQLKSTDWRTVFASALAQVADGMLNLLTVHPVQSGPGLSTGLQRRAFSLRHKRASRRPLQPPGAVVYDQRLYPVYEQWCAVRDTLDAGEQAGLLERAEVAFKGALTTIRRLVPLVGHTANASDWQAIVDALASDLESNLAAVRSAGAPGQWAWDERVHRTRGPKWVLRLVDAGAA